MSIYGDKELFIELLPDAEGSVHSDKLIIKTIYTMAYVEDIDKLAMRLERSALNLMFYLGHQHGDNIEFHYNRLFIDRFNSFLATQEHVPYHRQSLDRGMKQLRDYGFLLKVYRGVYVVNPKFFYRGDPAMRITVTKGLMARAMKYETIDIKKINEITE